MLKKDGHAYKVQKHDYNYSPLFFWLFFFLVFYGREGRNLTCIDPISAPLDFIFPQGSSAGRNGNQSDISSSAPLD